MQCEHEVIDMTKLDEVLDKYANIAGSLITILQHTQEIYGYLPTEAMYRISERTGIKPAKILGVATFYTQFRFKPIGKYLVMICQGTACHVNGSYEIYNALVEELNIEDGGTTEDGLFSIKNVACLGCCSLSPVMMVNEETYGSLTPGKAKEIIRSLKEQNL